MRVNGKTRINSENRGKNGGKIKRINGGKMEINGKNGNKWKKMGINGGKMGIIDEKKGINGKIQEESPG